MRSFCVLLAGAQSAFSQVTTGSITGTVADANGIVPGASVTIREVGKNTVTTATTDATGSYSAPFLVPGTYTVQVQVQGFKGWIREGIVLQVNQRARVDVTLEVGGIEEKTTVVASSPLLNTDSSEVGTVIEERAIKELPLNGRNFATLVYLTPGVTPGQAGENLSGASTFNPRGASNFNALGHQANANAWLIDGIDNNEFTFNTVIVAPSVEQVREFKVLTGVFSAEFGRGAGVVSVSTKSGNNTLHGTVFEYLRNDAFDARNFFVRKVQGPNGTLVKDPVPPLEPPSVRRRPRRRGGDSRPLRRPQPHVLLRRLRRHQGAARRDDGQHRADGQGSGRGDFSDYRDANGNLIVIYDPATTRVEPDGRVIRDPFPRQHHPARRISIRSAATSPACIRCRTPAPATSTTTSRRPIARSPTTRSRAASITRCRTTTRSSCGSTTASSGSMRRRGRRTAACRRLPRRRRSSTSGRSSPASRTRA